MLKHRWMQTYTGKKKNPNKLCQVKPTKQEVKIRCFHCSVKLPPVKCKMLQPGDRSSASARSIRLYKGTLSWKISNEVYFSNKWLLVQTARQSRRLWLWHWSALRRTNSAPGIWGTSMLPLSPGEESISHVWLCFKQRFKLKNLFGFCIGSCFPQNAWNIILAGGSCPTAVNSCISVGGSSCFWFWGHNAEKILLFSDYCLETPDLNTISVKDTSVLTGCLLHGLLARDFTSGNCKHPHKRGQFFYLNTSYLGLKILR